MTSPLPPPGMVVVAALLAVGGTGLPGARACGAEWQAAQAQARQAQVPAIPPRNSGPAARAHSRYHRGRHGTSRIIRRTPEVMREDAARVKRGDLFGTWSNDYLE